MNDSRKTKATLLDELSQLRRRVSDLEASERLLREKEERITSLLGQVPLGMFECDVNGVITFMNRREQTIGDYSVEEMLGTHIWDRMEPGPAKEELPNMLRRLAAEETSPEPYLSRHLSKSGEMIVVRTDWRYRRDAKGKVLGFVCIISDVTQEKRMEDALLQAHAELEARVRQRTEELVEANERLAIFQRFAEASEQGFGIAGLDGHISYVNQALCRIMGEDRPESVIGRHVSEYAPKGAGFIPVNDYLATVLQKGRFIKEGGLLTRQGTITAVSRYSFVIRDDQGEPAYFADVITDITERKRAEELLRKEHRTLRHLLQSSDHERRQIAYEIHDELAQELAGAIMQLDACRHFAVSDVRAAAEDAFSKAMEMLRKSHFEARRIISRIWPPILDELGVVQAIAHLVHEENRKAGPNIEFHSQVDFDRLPSSLENAIYRVAHESLLNAVKHSKSEKVRIELTQAGETLQIGVQDWGQGFLTEADCGERFGLNGIRERARLLGGSWTIQSEPGKGTRIAVQLPLTLTE